MVAVGIGLMVAGLLAAARLTGVGSTRLGAESWNDLYLLKSKKWGKGELNISWRLL